MSYPPGAIANLAAVPASTRSQAPNVSDKPSPGPDPHPPAQRRAIESKRAAVAERDLARFIRATVHLADEAFEDCDLRGVNGGFLFGGLGRRRTGDMGRRWYDEPWRRAARTAHQVLSERRLGSKMGSKM
jgi:hypothetical protein